MLLGSRPSACHLRIPLTDEGSPLGMEIVPPRADSGPGTSRRLIRFASRGLGRLDWLL